MFELLVASDRARVVKLNSMEAFRKMVLDAPTSPVRKSIELGKAYLI